MASPIQFYRNFQALMQQHGIRHVLTSGMACVEYGIQQITKDTDWIIHPEDLTKLVAMLCACERGLSGSNWLVSYRPLFGAPLLQECHEGGWTSHLAIREDRSNREHLAALRPLLGNLSACDDTRLERLLIVERAIWECVNRERYHVYQHEWKEFYRCWQNDQIGQWPSREPFAQQHRRVAAAASEFNLPAAPILTSEQKRAMFNRGIQRAVSLLAATPEEMQTVLFPIDVILP